MPVVAVVAHSGKSFGGGLAQLRRVLAEQGHDDPIWHEAAKSRKAPKCVRRAIAEGAELIFVWGGDGTVQRCIDAVTGESAVVAILPAGTANLLARNLGIPADIAEAVRIGLYGTRRHLDTGSVNGEHFAVMAGAGFDAELIDQAGRKLKARVGQVAYVFSGAKNLSARPVKTSVKVDGKLFFRGRVSCVLASFLGRGRTTACLNSESSRRPMRCNGQGRLAGSCRAVPPPRLSSRSLAESGSSSGSAARSATRLTAAREASPGSCELTCTRRR